MEQQVTKEHYNFGKYTTPGRWMSHYHQIRSILRFAPKSVLEIGVGDGVLRAYLQRNADMTYTSADIAADLQPDIVASVTALPVPDQSHDVTCAFQVLEHLPFEEVPKALAELCRVARKGVVISLPHNGPSFAFLLRLPLLPALRWACKIPLPQRHTFDGEHYWEIGKRGYPLSRVRRMLRGVADIESEFLVFENPYHRFFLLRPRR
jgi:SAM-dependent methyltransferase